MRGFIKAELFYLKKDLAFKSINAVFVLACALLMVIFGNKGGYGLTSPLEPLRIAVSFSLFLYFIMPMHACFFATEGFEHGSIQNIIASGQRRSGYFLGKFVLEVLAILWWLVLFFGIFYIFYITAALVTGSHIGNGSTKEDFIKAGTAIGLNLLYLSAYAAVIMMLGIMIRKAAPAVVAAFFFIFGNMLLTGYLNESSSAFLRTVSDYSLMTQIMKFSGMYVLNSQQIGLSGPDDYAQVVLIPLVVIAVCLSAAVIFLEKKDIHI
ncbi:hypothetical protein C2I18_17275 [Paenibacillus sp. PK3_47]|uniref:hypothetical protein n=1 Tax=Paenibacillus sp. PK3_47 TaxID=2072642 RepID=UPI00201D6ACB|nr:hypothetical protein [Paenibacillus sp. PK3_47]UQZ35123.1 hypothetical protein C2I18_17275 [Paenibacillus sp. PK3_47]